MARQNDIDAPSLSLEQQQCSIDAVRGTGIPRPRALQLLRSLDADRVERHCLDLATQFTSHAADLGLARVTGGPPSQIVVVRTAEAERLGGQLRQRGIRATALDDRLRFGFHYFDNGDDLARTVRALSNAVGRGVRSVRT